MVKENKNKDQKESDIKDKLVAINRVTKVVKGGRRFGFAALVVAGDESGKVGFGHGKAKEVPEAIKKATDSAKKRGSIGETTVGHGQLHFPRKSTARFFVMVCGRRFGKTTASAMSPGVGPNPNGASD